MARKERTSPYPWETRIRERSASRRPRERRRRARSVSPSSCDIRHDARTMPYPLEVGRHRCRSSSPALCETRCSERSLSRPSQGRRSASDGARSISHTPRDHSSEAFSTQRSLCDWIQSIHLPWHCRWGGRKDHSGLRYHAVNSPGMSPAMLPVADPPKTSRHLNYPRTPRQTYHFAKPSVLSLPTLEHNYTASDTAITSNMVEHAYPDITENVHRAFMVAIDPFNAVDHEVQRSPVRLNAHHGLASFFPAGRRPSIHRTSKIYDYCQPPFSASGLRVELERQCPISDRTRTRRPASTESLPTDYGSSGTSQESTPRNLVTGAMDHDLIEGNHLTRLRTTRSSTPQDHTLRDVFVGCASDEHIVGGSHTSAPMASSSTGPQALYDEERSCASLTTAGRANPQAHAHARSLSLDVIEERDALLQRERRQEDILCAARLEQARINAVRNQEECVYAFRRQSHQDRLGDTHWPAPLSKRAVSFAIDETHADDEGDIWLEQGALEASGDQNTQILRWNRWRNYESLHARLTHTTIV